MCNSNNYLQKNRLQYRLLWLCGMAVAGIIIAICFYKWGACALELSTDDGITKNLTLLILSLPVLVLLWYYRTHDVKQQIEKAQSNINVSLLNNGINLLLNAEKAGRNKRAAGLILLAQLRQQDEQLHPQIDAITQGIALERSKLRNAKLQGINLRDANLRGVNLQGANLRGADLRGVDLEGVGWEGADLRGVDLEGVVWEGAERKSANLQRADLQEADLRVANLFGANLRGADLRGANLRGADLRDANLQDANLQDADLRVDNLRVADLRGANLLGANLQGADLQEALYNSDTKFSAGFDPGTKGMHRVHLSKTKI